MLMGDLGGLQRSLLTCSTKQVRVWDRVTWQQTETRCRTFILCRMSKISHAAPLCAHAHSCTWIVSSVTCNVKLSSCCESHLIEPCDTPCARVPTMFHTYVALLSQFRALVWAVSLYSVCSLPSYFVLPCPGLQPSTSCQSHAHAEVFC
jgi:hypothetical protein